MENDFSLKKAKPAKRRGRVPRTLPSDLVEKRGVLENRCKRLGWGYKRPEDLIRANREHLESEAGIAIELAGFDLDRWNFVKDAQIIFHRYHKANGVRLHPKGATIVMEPEYQVGGPDDGPAMQPTEEQTAAMDVVAVSNWMRLDGQLTMYCQEYRSEFKQCVDLMHVAGPNFIKAVDMVLKGVQAEQRRK